jgi:glyoxylase-like metal-dependent hydrolase (beta-lactamase superfamily II)
MKARVLVVITVLGLMVGTATPQTVAPQDVKAVLQAAATAMGMNNLRTIQYSGTGTIRIFGQSYSVNEDWPRLDMPAYTRTIDYGAMYSKEEITRRQGNNPPRGGGFQPLQGDQKSIAMTSGKYSWNVNPDNSVTPAPADAEQREIEIILTPHGFIKAAMEAKDATAVTLMMALDDNTIRKTAGPGGRKVTYVAFTALGKYKVSGAIDDQNMVERTQTWIGNPVLGDLVWQFDYKDYKDFGGVKFPSNIHQHAGDIRNTTHHGIDLNMTDVKPNVAVAAVTVPDAVRNATAQPVRVESQKVADGIWLIAGGSHNSVAVEFKDFITVVEAPLSEERSLAVIKETQKLIPNKPIRYLVMTHHHFDHSSGIRTYLAQGAILVMHQMDKDYFDKLAFYPYPRMMQPDLLSTYYPRFASNKFPVFETVNPSPENKAKLVLSDGKRTMEMHHVQGLNHAADMLMVYLPTEKILVNADLYSPPAPGAAAPPPNPSMITFNQNIKRLKLDVATHLPIHGRMGTNDEFVKIMGVSSN